MASSGHNQNRWVNLLARDLTGFLFLKLLRDLKRLLAKGIGHWRWILTLALARDKN